MTSRSTNYELISEPSSLAAFAERHAEVPWLCFDTEFIGEKRFRTQLCLIQVASPEGIFLIDPLALDDLQPFLVLIADPQIQKITHAGENDYRLLYELFGTVPANVVDTQVAAGFVGYRYPVSYRVLIEEEAGVRLAKGYAVADWEQRPLRKKQLKYAVQDVLYLPQVWANLQRKLESLGRLEWLREECAAWEEKKFYYKDPWKEVLGSRLIQNLGPKEQLFLLRLLKWREEEAERRNHSREMVLPQKMISHIVRSVGAGRDALAQNRRIPERVVREFGSLFVELFEKPPTEAELEVLDRLPGRRAEQSPHQEIIMEMLALLIRYRALEAHIAPDLVVPPPVMKVMKGDPDYFDPVFERTWRREFLGEELLEWLRRRSHLKLEFEGGSFRLHLAG